MLAQTWLFASKRWINMRKRLHRADKTNSIPATWVPYSISTSDSKDLDFKGFSHFPTLRKANNLADNMKAILQLNATLFWRQDEGKRYVDPALLVN